MKAFRSRLRPGKQMSPSGTVPSISITPNGVVGSTTKIIDKTIKNTSKIHAAGIKAGLGFVKEASEAFAPLKSVVGGLVFVLEHHAKWVANKEDATRIAERLKRLLSGFLAREGGIVDEKEINRRHELLEKMQTIAQRLSAIMNQTEFSSYAAAASNASILSNLLEDIRDALMDYQTIVQTDLNDQTFRLMASDDIKTLQTLPRAPGASHLSETHHTCLKGTRTDLLHKLETWADDPLARPIYWLNGHAGSGKSTVAQSFCSRTFTNGSLGASFFCSRDYADRSDLHMIFPSLSFQLACRFPDFRACIVRTLRTRPDIGKESLHNQLVELLINPLMATRLSTIIIIDALDECKEAEPASAILSLLARHIDTIPSVKFFITGRPEFSIRNGFRLPSIQPLTTICVLHEIEKTEVDHDIELFLTTQLSEAVKSRSDADLLCPSPWPSAKDVHTLTEKSGRLFVFAATAVSFITSPFHLPAERLALLNDIPENTLLEGMEGIDRLYTTVLEHGYAKVDNRKDLEVLGSIISFVVLAMNPLSMVDMAELLGFHPRAITSMLRSMHAVLNVPDSYSSTISVYHKSFQDYITDPIRCKNPRFLVDPSVYHPAIAVRCLDVMNRLLRKNICSLPRYSMNEELDIGERRARIGGPLEYASRFIMDHLQHTKPSDSPWQLLDIFLREKLLLWIEVLSLLDDLPSATYALNRMDSWLESMLKDHLLEIPSFVPSLQELIRDSQRFLLQFRDCLRVSALHLYHSALPLAPTRSLLRQLHQVDLEGEVNVLYGVDGDWCDLVTTILVPEQPVSHIAFSHDGRFLAISQGHPDRPLNLVSSVTGAIIQTLKPWDGSCDVSFSPDDSIIVSGGTRGSVHVWDLQTGGLMTTWSLPHSTSSPIQCVDISFSPTGQYLAARDNTEGYPNTPFRTVYIWDAASWNLLYSFRYSPECHVYRTSWLMEDPPKLIATFCLKRSEPMDYCVEAWSPPDGTTTRICDQNTSPIGVDVSFEDSLIACRLQNTLTLIDSQSYETLRSISIPNSRLRDFMYSKVIFSPANHLLFCAGLIFDVADLGSITSTVTPVPEEQITTFCPKGDFLATSERSATQIWSFKSSRDLAPISLTDRQHPGFNISPDGSTILSFTPRATLKLSVGSTVSVKSIPQMQDREEKLLWIRSNVAISPDGSSCFGFYQGTSSGGSETVQGLFGSKQLENGSMKQMMPSASLYTHFIDNTTVVSLSFDISKMYTNAFWKPDLTIFDIKRGESLCVHSPSGWAALFPIFHSLMGRGRPNAFWIDIDALGTIRLHNQWRQNGHWNVFRSGEDPSGGGLESELVAPLRIRYLKGQGIADHEGLVARLATDIPHPVISPGGRSGWIYNHLDQRILWVCNRAAAKSKFKQSWRWCNKKLMIAGDTDIGGPFVLDFAGVDVTIPSPSDTYRRLEFTTMTVTGMGKQLFE